MEKSESVHPEYNHNIYNLLLVKQEEIIYKYPKEDIKGLRLII